MSTTNSTSMGFGTPNYTAGRKSRWPLSRKLKFAAIFRILPQANGNPTWFQYFRKHFGYSIEVANNGKTRLIPKPWGCIEEKDRNTKMVTRECEECSLIASRTLLKQQLDLDYKGGKLDGKSYQTQVVPVSEFLSKHNLDKRYWMNAININGEIGLLGLKYKAYKAMRACMDEALKKGIDPMRVDQGVLFEFIITGESFNDIDYACKLVTESKNVDGILYETIKKAPLTAEQLQQLPPLCWDLLSQEVSGIITPAQVKALVDSGGDPKMVEQILGTSSVAAEEGEEDVAATPPSGTPQPFVLPQQAPAYPAPVPPAAPAPAEKAALTEFEQFQAWKATQAAAAPVPTPTAVSTIPVGAFGGAGGPTLTQGFAQNPSVGTPTPVPLGDLSKLSPEEFMARFGKPGQTAAGKA